MATTKKTTKKKPATRFITEAEAKSIKAKYYALRRMLYAMTSDDKYNATVKAYAQKALKGLDKWRGNTLNIPRMSSYLAE